MHSQQGSPAPQYPACSSGIFWCTEQQRNSAVSPTPRVAVSSSPERPKTTPALWITAPKKGKIEVPKRVLEDVVNGSEFHLQDGTDEQLLAPLPGLLREGTFAPAVSNLDQTAQVLHRWRCHHPRRA